MSQKDGLTAVVAAQKYSEEEMVMKKEQLVELGLDEEVAKKVMALHGEEITKAKKEITDKDTSINELKKQLADRDKDLAKLQKDNGDNSELKEQIKTLQQEYKDLEKNNAEKLEALQRESALSALLSEAKVKNPKAVAALLDGDKITFKDNELSGVKEQLDALKKSDSYLFELGTTSGGYQPKSGQASVTQDKLSDAMKDEKFNMTEFLKSKVEENE